MKDANRYLQQVFLKEYWNTRNTVLPRDSETRYQPLPEGIDLNEVFCKRYARQIRNDCTIHYEGDMYIIKNRDGPMKGKYVELREYPNGSWKAYLGDKCLELSKIVVPFRKWAIRQK